MVRRIIRYYSSDAVEAGHFSKITSQLKSKSAVLIAVEKCYHVEIDCLKEGRLSEKTEAVLKWLLKHPQSGDKSLLTSSLLSSKNSNETVIEIGPRFNFSTPFSTNCVNICQNVGLTEIKRLEFSLRYLIEIDGTMTSLNDLVDLLGDRMTQCQYTEDNFPKESFDESLVRKEDWHTVPIMTEGRLALEKINLELGLAFGDWDLDFYTNLFKNVLKRDPTTVELFDCAQSNSEHSRHWFFRGKMIVDGEEKSKSLIRMIMDTQLNSNPNNTIKFSDNSSAIEGFKHQNLIPTKFTGPGVMKITDLNSDLIFTAETHNMPTAVAPFSGATTGTGGRLRDVQGVGRGGIPIAGTAGYCVGALNIPGYSVPYEDASLTYPPSFANPMNILIEASNGASDYGNKFGEPLISGFTYSYSCSNATGERDEYVKPIMFSGGMGTMDSRMREKYDPTKGVLLAKIGGPVYRIGVGGGAASSVEVQGDNSCELDFNAVQRGDPEMENKLNRVVRACIEMGDENPILAIHDQGAGGNGNVLKELVEPGFAGAVIFSKEFLLGDPTINALELWGAEYQENDAILCKPEHRKLLQAICDRERCPISFVGVVTGNGFVSLIDSEANFEKYIERSEVEKLGTLPFDLKLKHVLGDMPKREYNLNHENKTFNQLDFSSNKSFAESLLNVMSIVSVGSKRFLTNKVDRCVTGLIAQQQCVGPLHTPLADFGLVTISHFGNEGIATSIGAQPIKGLINAKNMARLSVAEAISNLAFVAISDIADVKCSGNWMWAAKLPGEGAKMYDACESMCAIMNELNIAVDGGKDSLSMAARIKGETVKSPGTLVISTYAPCPDVRVKITPDIKSPAKQKTGELLWINIEGLFRLGGSSLAQSISQQGCNTPTLNKSNVLKNAFNVTQDLMKQNLLLSGHDISDGGLIVTVLEMAFAGLSGLQLDFTNVLNFYKKNIMDDLSDSDLEYGLLFAEECGWVLEVSLENVEDVISAFENENVPVHHIGQSVGYGPNANIKIQSRGKIMVNNVVSELFKQWERTSFELEKKQANSDCAIEEFNSLDYRVGPKYSTTFNPDDDLILTRSNLPIRVAVLREEGVNSDREMLSTLYRSGFEVHDVTMSDLISKKTTLENYKGLVFAGGFSYADTLGSAKGWAANIIFNTHLTSQFDYFKNNPKTFSLGICNGCQLMALIGWVGGVSINEQSNQIPDVAVSHNKSERFECRFTSVIIPKSNSILLKKMQGSILGCWSAHGEGQFLFKTKNILDKIKSNKCVALQYVDDNQKPTEMYPMNPNGSVEGIAGLCSLDGRHLALMPHPERTTLMYQWPYTPPEFNPKTSPWQAMFDEAYNWCSQNK
ncbi:PFAS family protein [Megaselia abdita]